MRKLIILFAFFSLILCVFGGKLSESEDRKRAEKCGRVGKASSSDYAPPWAVRIYLTSTKDDPKGYRSSATMISQRHALADGWDAVRAVNTSSLWEWVDGKQLDVKKDCKDDVIPFPTKLLKNYNILLSTCKDPDVCGTQILRKVVSAWYIGNCDFEFGIFGVILLEISSNVPKDDFFRPVCMPVEKKAPAVGDEALFHSSGDKTLDSKMDGMIKWTTSKIIKCDDWRRLDSMTCATHNSCAGDRGGALVQKIDNKDTVVGISSWNSGGCDKKKSEKDVSVSMTHYKDKICELAGICQTPVEDTSESSSGRFGSFLMVFVMIVLVL